MLSLIKNHQNELVMEQPIDENKNKYLLLACQYKNHVIADHFLLEDADVNVVNEFQINCLTFCVNNNDIKTTKVLLKHHVKICYQNPRNLENSVTELIGPSIDEPLFPSGMVPKRMNNMQMIHEQINILRGLIFEEEDVDDVLPED